MSGFVSFVSAGPGDPELLTVRAIARLQAADAVLYDDLAAGPILAHARPGADLVGVGKRAGRVSPKQAHVSRLLVEHAKAGLKVVRLKSGDAGIFGRLEEEIDALQRASIPFEIVPGVSSASAAAAAAQIPLTRRTTARRLQFVTAADTSGQLPGDLNMAALADPEATTAVFMGRRTFARLAAALIAAGMDPATPVVVVEAASHPDERIVRSTLAEAGAGLGADPRPTLILYGPLHGGAADGGCP